MLLVTEQFFFLTKNLSTEFVHVKKRFLNNCYKNNVIQQLLNFASQILVLWLILVSLFFHNRGKLVLKYKDAIQGIYAILWSGGSVYIGETDRQFEQKGWWGLVFLHIPYMRNMIIKQDSKYFLTRPSSSPDVPTFAHVR